MGSCATKPKTTKEIVLDQTTPMNKNLKEIRLTDLNPSKKPQRKQVNQKKQVIDTRIHQLEPTQPPRGSKHQKTKTQSDIKLIKLSLQRHFIFTSLSETQKDLLIDEMSLFLFNSNETIFEQNSKGKEFYVVSTGRLDVIINGVKKTVVKEGDSFGELALLHDTPRTATVKSITNVALWVLNRETFRQVLQELNMQNYLENKVFLDSVPLFATLSPVQKESLINCLTVFHYSTGEKIVNEGDPGDLFYLIKEGSVSCLAGGKEVRKMFKGDFFGEQALLYNSTRTATVVAAETSKCLGLNREDLKVALGESLEQIIYKNSFRIAVDKNPLLQKLTKIQTESLMTVMKIINLEPTESLHEKLPSNKGFFIIVKGKLIPKLKNDSTEKPSLSVFDVFGIEELVKQEILPNDAILTPSVSSAVAFIDSVDFFSSIGGDFDQVSKNNEILASLRKVQLFKSLTDQQLGAMALVMKVQNFQDGEKIVEQGAVGDSFYLIKNGKVEIQKDGQVLRTHTKNDYFGERSLLFDDFRSATATSMKKVTCFVLYKSDFLSILNENIRKQLLERIELQDDQVKISDLVIAKHIGSGMFGNVFLAAHRTTRKLYALKTVDRRKISAYEIEENVVLERKVLLQLDHSFIMKLVKTFKDSRRLYFLMEFIEGVDLFDAIREMGLLKEQDSRFYISSIFIMLDHLHERNIIYRDLKPENIVIDKAGYPKLIDLGTAKFVQGRTYTIVGTPHYMAPEIITSHGYSLTADYWTVGVILFEFLIGVVPFGEDESDPYAIYEQVQKHRLVFPSWIDNTRKVKEFISQLLNINPSNRFSGSIELVKGHLWFAGFDWEKLLSKEIRPPFIPKVLPVTQAVESALSSKKNLEEFISKIEMKDDIAKHKRRHDPPIGWDDEF
jgi:cGMP-dependent protein kinase